jgi:hypothetical protein
MMSAACHNALEIWISIVHSVTSMLYAPPVTGTRHGQPARALTLALLLHMVILAAVNVFVTAECMLLLLLRAFNDLEKPCSECSNAAFLIHSSLAQLAAFATYSPTALSCR